MESGVHCTCLLAGLPIRPFRNQPTALQGSKTGVGFLTSLGMNDCVLTLFPIKCHMQSATFLLETMANTELIVNKTS